MLAVVVVLGAVAGGTFARANGVGHKSGRLAPAGRVVLGSSFRPIRAGVDQVLASGDYLLITITNNVNFPGDEAPILINDRLGTTTALDPRCAVDGLGPPWVLMSCPQTSNPNGPYDLELYSLADGSRQKVTPSPGVPQCSSGCSDMSPQSEPDAVGPYWIRWHTSCYHCGDTYSFQNIQTGELRGDPTNATTFADLDSPALAHQTCPGVSLMRGVEGYGGRPWGSLTSYGELALATGTDSQGNPAAFLERCGTGMRRLLASWPLGLSSPVLASNARAIVWQPAPNRLNEPVNRLDGLFLPSLQTFTIPLPSAIVKLTGLEPIALTSSELYVRVWESGMLWRTASPTSLPLNTSRPRLTRSGSTLTCRRGSWRNAARFAYAWRVNGTAKKGAGKPSLAVGNARKRLSVSCSVTASNAAGTTTASSAQLHVR